MRDVPVGLQRTELGGWYAVGWAVMAGRADDSQAGQEGATAWRCPGRLGLTCSEHGRCGGAPGAVTSHVHVALGGRRGHRRAVDAGARAGRRYLGRMLDPGLRERIMVVVSRVNACAGCTWVHERWALRAGVSAAELEAIGLGDLARLDDRSRAAVIYAAALAENRFRGTADRELAALARRHLTAAELRAVEAVARMMALANLSASTLGRASRADRRPGRPADASARTTGPRAGR